MTRREPWDQVVADAAPGDHIGPLYQDQEFLSRAVFRYARAGLVNGEGVLLFPTLTHWNAFRRASRPRAWTWMRHRNADSRRC